MSLYYGSDDVCTLPTWSSYLSVNKHSRNVDFDSGDDIYKGSSYNKYRSSLESSNRSVEKGTKYQNKIKQSKVIQLDELDSILKHHNSHINNNIITKAEQNKNKALNKLTEVPSDKTIQSDLFNHDSKHNVIDILNSMNDNNAIFYNNMLKAMDLLTTQLKVSNDLKRNQVEAHLHNNKLQEVKSGATTLTSSTLAETLSSIAQNLEYIPNMLEAMTIHSDRYVELQNTANSHHLQKNINDTAIFKDNKKDNPNANAIRSLNKDISTFLQSINNNLHDSKIDNSKVATHLSSLGESMGYMPRSAKASEELAKTFGNYSDVQSKYINIKMKDDSEEAHGVMDSVIDFFTETYEDIINEADIFSGILATNITNIDTKGGKNG